MIKSNPMHIRLELTTDKPGFLGTASYQTTLFTHTVFSNKEALDFVKSCLKVMRSK